MKKRKVLGLNSEDWQMIDVDGGRYSRIGDVSHLAKVIGISKNMAKRLIHKEEIHSMKINGVLYVDDDDLTAWIEFLLPDNIDEWLEE